MSGLFHSFVEVNHAGGVATFAFPLWLTLLVTGVFLLVLIAAVIFATRSKIVGGLSLLLSLVAAVAVVPTFWVDEATVRANQFQVCTWHGYEYQTQVRSLDQYRAVVRLLGGGVEELHLTSDSGEVEVWSADDLLTSLAVDEVVVRLQALQVPVVDRR